MRHLGRRLKVLSHVFICHHCQPPQGHGDESLNPWDILHVCLARYCWVHAHRSFADQKPTLHSAAIFRKRLHWPSTVENTPMWLFPIRRKYEEASMKRLWRSRRRTIRQNRSSSTKVSMRYLFSTCWIFCVGGSMLRQEPSPNRNSSFTRWISSRKPSPQQRTVYKRPNKFCSSPVRFGQELLSWKERIA